MTGDYGSATDRAPADDEPGLREALEGGPAPARRDAALALASAAESGVADATTDGGGLAPATVDALAARVREDSSSDVRQFAVEALGVAGERVDPIRDALADDDEWVRAEAVVAHSRVAPGDVDVLRDVLASDDSGWVRRNAVVALGKAGGASHADLVECIKTDPHPAVREYAAQFLADVVDDVEEAERVLAAVLAREANAFVRAKAAESLGELGTDRAETALEEYGVTDQSEDVVRTATRALADARGVDPDALDVDANLDDPAEGAPGTGPDAPDERALELGTRTGGEPTAGPGGAPGFDPREHLDADLDDRN
ncbi:HEAT repeat domain-containing protein [Halorubellus sp. JP-L1]|uniref:HEAT repeat domain-containing protein n=1 Tax=Halorubellus sp. JP-L1 TaxID=2715753 RepID=UPI00140A435E|nr:HEAT repeat domain-containing protein [Halorubellus sp. JP-L1]NHN42783.1 HEAT repeat domain-containing protein [Halorubellus sp. JP-L1]